MKIKIRLFQDKQAEELSQMINLVVDELEKKAPQLDYNAIRKEDEAIELVKASKEDKMWIATADGKIVGTLSLGRNRLRRFFVHPNYQRKGIGKMLLKELITCAKKSGLISVWAGSDLGAIVAYKKMGFKAG